MQLATILVGHGLVHKSFAAAMVSNRFESKMSWRPVAKPAVKPIVMSVRRAPPRRPKPGGQAVVYVYETPGVPPVEYVMPVTEDGRFPPNLQPIQNGYYDQENEDRDFETSDADRMRKLRDRAEEAGEGYKLLADVDPQHFKNSSRGGRMFMKQRKRMQDFTSPESVGKVQNNETDPQLLEDEELSGDRSTPWDISKTSSSAIKYTPRSIFQSTFSKKRKRKDQILPPLRSPPPEWRAKVESAYKYPQTKLKKPIRIWNSVDESRKTTSRSGSAPPFMSHSTDPESVTARQNSGSVIGMRNENTAPQQGVGVVTTPYIQYDFNARPVGWSKAYARQY